MSVIVPCGGRVRYLEAALRSVAAQTDPDWEIVLVNDARSPEVTALAHRLGVPVTAVDGPGQGPASARNAGITAARGVWLLFLDDDDLLTPDAIAALRTALDRNPESAWAAGRLAYIDAAGAPLANVHPGRFATGDIYGAMILNCQLGPPATVLVRKDLVLRQGGFAAGWRFGEDYDLWLGIARDEPIAATDRVVVLYRVHPDQASANWREVHEGLLRVLEKHRTRARPGSESRFDASEAAVLVSYGDGLYLNNEMVAARIRWRAARRKGGLPLRSALSRWFKSHIPFSIARAMRHAKARPA